MTDQQEPKQNGSEQLGVEQSLEVAMGSIRKAWDNENAWDHLEELGESFSRPGAISEAYMEALSIRHAPATREMICQRAVNFHDEWFGDDPEKMRDVLAKVIKLDPEASWPYERVTEVLTAAGMWDDLFAIYDDSLGGETTIELKKRLLEDAANIAKDIADQPDRALDYLMKLQALDRTNSQRLGMIERLLERRESFGDLVDLWTDQLEVQSVAEARDTRVRIAKVCIQNTGEFARAFDVLKVLLDENPGLEEGCGLLEQLISSNKVATETRIMALDLLEPNYEAAKKPELAIAAIENVIELLEPSQRIALHRKAASKLIVLKDEENAIAHYSKILLLDPGNTDALHHVRNLADKLKRPDLSAAALDAAAKASNDQSIAVSLMLESAEIHAYQLNAAGSAIELYERALAVSAEDRRRALMIAGHLNELYDSEGRTRERIEILERLAELDPTKGGRRAALEESARLSRQEGDLDRALTSLRRILEESPHDIEAMGAQIEILAQADRSEELMNALLARASAPVVSEQRRADLVWAAGILERELNNPERATEIWLEILEEYGPRADALEALNDLLEQTGRFEELKNVLGNAISSWYDYHTKYFVRLGEVSSQKLDAPMEAADFFQKALRFNPADESALAGLEQLIERGTKDLGILQVLVDALRHTKSYAKIHQLTPVRLEVATDNQARVEILLEAANISEGQLEDPGRAMEYLAEAFPLAPANTRILQNLKRLGESTERWDLLASTLIEGAQANLDDPASKRQHLEDAGSIFEHKLEDWAKALSAFEGALRVAPGNLDLLRTCLRLSLGTKKYSVTASSLVGLAETEDPNFERSFNAVEELIANDKGWTSLLSRLEEEIAGKGDEHLRHLSMLDCRMAFWYKDNLHNFETAQSVAARALERDGSNLKAAQLLATLQREAVDPGLTTTLSSIYKLNSSDLDPLFEAASLPIEVDTANKRSVLMELWEAASRMWKRGIESEGYKSVTECALFSTEKLVEIDLSTDHWKSAVQYLSECAEIVTDQDEQRRLLRQAADILASRDQIGEAINLLERVISRRGDDKETIALATDLLERNQEWSRLLLLRKRELALAEDVDARLGLRLQIARLSAMLEGSGDQLSMLEENLKEAPGHPESLEGAFKLLKERAKYDEFVELCTEQAGLLLERDEPRRAARMWSEIAHVAEHNLNSSDLAIEALNKVVELDVSPVVIDTLARLHGQKGELAEAAGWLEKRLERSEKGERVSTALRLAKILLQLEQPKKATGVLQEAFDEAPRNGEVRRLLFERYHVAERWDNLAAAFYTAAQHVPDEDQRAKYLSESARLYFEELQKPELAVGALELYMELVPEDGESKRKLADALMAAQQHEKAGAIFTEILEGFGRRRSPARAEIHQCLAQVARAQGNPDEALAQLDAATKMDNRNIGALNDLASMARETGDLVLAERAFRSLLLIVRRAQPEEAEAPSTGAAEVLFELSAIAAAKGEEEKGVELTESALESLTKDKGEAKRIVERLVQREQFDMVIRVCETRLSFLEKPRQRADVYAEMARILDEKKEQPKEAFEAYLSAIKEFPSSPLHHDHAEELAIRIEAVDEYEKTLQELLETSRRTFDAQDRCEVLLRLAKGAAYRSDDLGRGWELFCQAEQTGVREVDVWRLGVKLAVARGQEDEQVRLLTNLSKIGASEEETETRADVLYRLAEIQLSSEESLESGIESFKQAFNEEPGYERAALVLVRSIDTLGALTPLMTQYEKVARASEDPKMILDFLGRAADSTTVDPALLREGAELAESLDQLGRAEEFMLKAVELADADSHGKELVGWAILGLAKRRKEARDLAGATKWLVAAVDVVDQEVLFSTGLDIADDCATEGGDATLAVKIFEKLMELDPSDVRVWLPLSKLYSELGNVALLDSLVEQTAYAIEDPSVRNELRITHARAIIDLEDRGEEAVDILKNILLDQPGHQASLELLSEHLEKQGLIEELLDLLEDQYNRAKERRNIDEIRAVALIQGRKLESLTEKEPASIYRDALSFAPNDLELVNALLSVIDPEEDKEERLNLLERTLSSADEQRVSGLAFKLAEAYREMGDETGALRVLETAFYRLPGDTKLREMLESHYETTGDFGALVRLQKAALERVEADADRLTLLVSIAKLCRERLEDTSKELDALRQATQISPDDFTLTVFLIDALRRSGETSEGISLATEALERVEDDASRLGILLARAEMQSRQGEHSPAVEDLEKAYSLNPEAALEPLFSELQEVQRLQQGEEDTDNERKTVVRLVELCDAPEKNDEKLALLREWLTRVRADGEMWEQLMTAETEIENWLGAATAAKTVVMLSEGEKQIEAAKILTDASQKCGQLELAQDGLEYIFKNAPDNQEVRDEIKKVYELVGALDKLTTLLLEEIERAENKGKKAELMRQVGNVYLKAGDTNAGLAALEQSLDLAPGNLETVATVADVHLKRGELARAGELIDSALHKTKIKRGIAIASLFERKATIVGATGEKMEELKLLEQASAADPSNAALLVMVADLAEQLEQWKTALKVLKNLTLAKGERPISEADTFFRLGRASMETGDERRAMLYVKRALQEEPKHAAALAFMEKQDS